MSKTIATILSLKDKISSPLVKVSKNVDKVTREMKKSQNQVERWKKNSVKAMDNVIKKTAKVALAAGALAGAFAVKVGFDGLLELEEGAAKVKSIAGEALNLKDIQNDLLKYSTATGVSVQELAETQYSAISAGIKAAESIEATVTSTKLAKAGFTDANSALKIMASTMNVFSLEGTEAMQSISDKLLVTQNLGVTTVAELSQSLGPLTPIAKSAGASIDELFAGMAALTKNGLETNEAVTAYKGVLTSVIKPTSEASKMAKQLGIDFSTSAIESKGMAGFLQEIKEKTGGNTEVMGKLFGNVRALSGALILAGDGMDDFNTTLDAMKNSAGETDKAFEIMTNTIGFKLDKFKNTTKNIFTSIMMSQSGAIGEYIDKIDSWVTNNEERIQGWVKNIGDGITRVIEFIKGIFNFIKEHEKLISTILVFIMSLYTVIKVIGILKTVFTALNTIWLIFNGTLVVSPIGWIILAIGALIAIGYALWRNWDTIKEKAAELANWMGDKWNSIKEWTSNAWESIKLTVSDKWNSLKDTVSNIGPSIKNEVIATWDSVKTGTANMWESIKSTVSDSIESVKGVITTAISNLPDHTIASFARMKDGVLNIFEGMKNIFSGYWKVIKNIFMGAMLVIINLVTLDFESLKTDIAAIWENIKVGFVQIWEGIKQVFSGAGEFIRGYLALIWESLKNGIRITWTTITNFLSNTWENIKTGAVEGWNSFKEGVANAITSSVEWIKTTWTNTVEWFSTLPSRLFEKGVAMFTSLKEGIASIKESLISGTKDTGTSIIEAFTDLPGRMLEIGKDIMAGLADGIKNAVTAPIRAAKEAASKVADGIRNKLKIQSPSKVTMEYGEFTTEGLAKGMKDRLPKLEAVVSQTYEVIKPEEKKLGLSKGNDLLRKVEAPKIIEMSTVNSTNNYNSETNTFNNFKNKIQEFKDKIFNNNYSNETNTITNFKNKIQEFRNKITDITDISTQEFKNKIFNNSYSNETNTINNFKNKIQEFKNKITNINDINTQEFKDKIFNNNYNGDSKTFNENKVLGNSDHSRKDITVNVYFQGVTVGEEEFFEKAGQHIAHKIKLVIENTM